MPGLLIAEKLADLSPEARSEDMLRSFLCALWPHGGAVGHLDFDGRLWQKLQR